MKILARTRSLVSATLHDWFDRLERPEQLARHTLRERAEAIDAATTAVARSIAVERWLIRRRDERRTLIERWDLRVAEALKRGAEASARYALAQKFELNQRLEKLDCAIAEAATANDGLRAQLDSIRDQYQRAASQLDVQSARATLAAATSQVAGATRREFDPGSALDRIERSTLEAEAQAELNQDLSAGLDRQFARAEREKYVQAELGRLRSM